MKKGTGRVIRMKNYRNLLSQSETTWYMGGNIAVKNHMEEYINTKKL
jgi:hypothetical protein